MKFSIHHYPSVTKTISRFSSLTLCCLLFTPAAVTALEKPDDRPGEELRDGRDGQDGRESREGKKKKRDDDRRGRGSNFKSLDTDTDGYLSFEEFSASERLARIEEEKRRRLFNFLDRNKDAKLEEKELKPRDHGWLSGLLKDFRRLDRDQSDALDLAEFSQAKEVAEKEEDARVAIFKRIDRNKDGVIQREELKGSGRSKSRHDLDFKKYDTNDSGGLDYAEFSKLPFVGRLPDERRRAHFDRIDTDNNGEISRDETRAAPRKSPRPPRLKDEKGPDRPRPPRPDQPGPPEPLAPAEDAPSE